MHINTHGHIDVRICSVCHGMMHGFLKRGVLSFLSLPRPPVKISLY